jgi:hypothetical protein
MGDETDVPIADGLDSWWRTAANSADAADKEKDAVEAADFQQARTYRYLASGGTDDIGDFEYGFGAATNKGGFR